MPIYDDKTIKNLVKKLSKQSAQRPRVAKNYDKTAPNRDPNDSQLESSKLFQDMKKREF